ncbi:uncharacterized protein [Nicotiana sylvestris]|uniref:uncharacterized protein n=1 Tax=Nicotiana sylvestris TaxID=4096 RepID=UPI00388CEAE9
MPATGPYFLLMGLRGIQPYAPYWVMRQLGRYQVMHPDEDLSVYAVEKNTTRAEPERPAKKPDIQEFVEASQEQWAWLAKENEYRATIGKLEKQIRELQFKSGLQVAVNEGEKKRLTKENEALQAQIQKMKIAAENPARNDKDENLINNLRQKVNDHNFDLNKAESELARARKQLAKNANERAHLVKKLKEKYDNEVARLKKRVITTEDKIIRQAKNFKAEREQCYMAMERLERDFQQLQEQNQVAEQTLEAKIKQIGRLLQEKGVIRERVKRVANYIAIKYSSCEDMTRYMFFSTVMIFVRRIMEDLYHLQGDLASRPAARPNNAPRVPGAIEALMYS